jgi:hypothetical protein
MTAEKAELMIGVFDCKVQEMPFTYLVREYERERSIAAQWDELYCIWRGLFIGGEDPP